MKPISNLNSLIDKQNRSLTVALEPGSSESEVSNLLLIDYKVVSYANRKMVISIKPETPELISINPIPDIVRITFIDVN